MIAISSAYKEALIAVDINGKKATKSLPSSCKHSENILPVLNELLENINCSILDNQDFAIVIGPGSFTGIRIAIALAKGFACGNSDFKFIPLTTFELMAYTYVKNYAPLNEFYCVIDALSERVFVSKFDKFGNKIGDEIMINKVDLKDIKEKIVCLMEENLSDEKVCPTTDELLELAFLRKKEEKYQDINTINPLYIRKSQAEEGQEKKS